jgi:hypothetical protein
MPPVFAQVAHDSLCACKLAQLRRCNGVGFSPASRLTYGRYMVNIDR